MAGVAVCAGSVGTVKALWEERIQRLKEDREREKERSNRKALRGITMVWQDRIYLARLKEKVVTEEGRVVLRIEKEVWKAMSLYENIVLKTLSDGNQPSPKEFQYVIHPLKNQNIPDNRGFAERLFKAALTSTNDPAVVLSIIQ